MKRIAIGGPAYGNKVSTRHCQSVVAMALTLHRQVEIRYRHSSMLPENRDALLRDAVLSGFDAFISMDADTYLDHRELKDSLAAIDMWLDTFDEDTENPLAFVGAPVQQGNGQWNVCHKDGTRWAELPKLQSYDAGFVGTGFVIYNLPVYRHLIREMPSLPLFVFGYDSHRKHDPWIGEDSYHCLLVRRAGLNFVVDPAIRCGHAHPMVQS